MTCSWLKLPEAPAKSESRHCGKGEIARLLLSRTRLFEFARAVLSPSSSAISFSVSAYSVRFGDAAPRRGNRIYAIGDVLRLLRPGTVKLSRALSASTQRAEIVSRLLGRFSFPRRRRTWKALPRRREASAGKFDRAIRRITHRSRCSRSVILRARAIRRRHTGPARMILRSRMQPASP